MKPTLQLKNGPGLRSTLPRWKARAMGAGKEVAQIAAGSALAAGAIEGVKTATRKRKNEFSGKLGLKDAAKWTGVIAAGDVLGEEADKHLLGEKKKKKARMLVKKGIEQKTAVPGNGPTSFAAIARRNLRGRAPFLPKKTKSINFEVAKKKSFLNKHKTAIAGAVLGGAYGTGVGHLGAKAIKGLLKETAGKGMRATPFRGKGPRPYNYLHPATNEVFHQVATRPKLTTAALGVAGTAYGAGVGHLHDRNVAKKEARAKKQKQTNFEEKNHSALKKAAIGAGVVGTGIAAVAGGKKLAKAWNQRPRYTPHIDTGKDAWGNEGVRTGHWTKQVNHRPADKRVPDVTRGERKEAGELIRLRRMKRVAEAPRQGKPLLLKDRSKPPPLPKKQFEDMRPVTCLKKPNWKSVIARKRNIRFERNHEGKFTTTGSLGSSLRAARRHVVKIKRAGEVVSHVTGKRDPRKKPFYKKEWFAPAVGTAALGAGIYAHRNLTQNGERSLEEGAHAAYTGAKEAVRKVAKKVHFGALMVHSPMFPMKAAVVPKKWRGIPTRTPGKESRAAMIDRLKRMTALHRLFPFFNNFASGGLGKIVGEGVVDALGLGETTTPTQQKKKKKISTAALSAANESQPDLGPDNNNGFGKGYMQDARPRREFYGTSEGQRKGWDTRGRASAKTTWWTHSPSKNSVRVVRSDAEKGPRVRRGKKWTEKTSTHKKALAAASVAALGLGGLAVNRHLRVRALTKEKAALGKTVEGYAKAGASHPTHTREEVKTAINHRPAPTTSTALTTTKKPEIAPKKTRSTKRKNTPKKTPKNL